jgi:hypothetical protein
MQLNNLHHNNYLSNYDLLYKGNSKSIDNIIKIKSLVVDFNLKKELINHNINLKNNAINISSKFYLLFYLTFALKFNINYKIIKNIESNYSLIIEIKKLNYIYFIIYKIYIYYISNILFKKNTNFYLIKNLSKINKELKNEKYNSINSEILTNSTSIQKINFKLQLPIISIHLLNYYPNIIFDKFSYRNTFISINFHLIVPKFNFLNTNSILNLPFLWIFK